MKSFHSYKKLLNRVPRYVWPAVVLVVVSAVIMVASRHAYSPVHQNAVSNGGKIKSAKQSSATQKAATKPPTSSSTKPTSPTAPAPSSSSSAQSAPVSAFAHSNITTTIFWVGEKASGDNGGIANSESSWDEKWKDHFGGFDDPSSRNGFYPAAFTPKENPFYFALPYSDIDNNGNRRPSANACPLYASMKSQPYSWCKNSWIAIRHGGKVAYAQWQDTGPYEEDDTAYVFGSAAPKNHRDTGAGLDVSPAVRDYLGLGDVESCDWVFVSSDSVAPGPWKNIVTTDLGDSI